MLGSMMKSQATSLSHPLKSVNQPFVQHILLLSHLVAGSVIRSTVSVSAFVFKASFFYIITTQSAKVVMLAIQIYPKQSVK